jgi:hypothetical protein
MSAMERDELVQWLGKTKTAAHRKVAEHLKSYPVDMRFEDRVLCGLLQFHPNRKFSKSAVTFVLSARPPYYTKALYVEALTGGLLDCSWSKCIENLYGKYSAEREKKAKCLNALRNDAFKSAKSKAAHETYANGGECAVCKNMCRHLDIDHDGKPFAQIVDEFMEKNKLDMTMLKIKYRKNAFELQQRVLKKAWRAFHDENAELKGVCHTCNCSKGSGGYKHKKQYKTTEAGK